ncbi:MAG TPA: VWA domain-containing protein, partial [Polyangiaceae bacterium]|nr:VWA domain-containing protein [Polyangiaceae bacterium]
LLGIVLMAPIFLLIVPRSLADLPWQQQALSVFLRLSFLCLLALSLAQVARTEKAEKVCTVFLVDVSDSVTDEALGDAKAAIAAALLRRKKDDLARVVTFAHRPRFVEMDEPSTAPSLVRHDADKATHLGAGTNIEAALQLAYGLYPPGYLRHAVVFTDGVETEGDFLAEASRAQKFGVKVSTVPYKRPVPGEIAIQRLRVPDRVKVGEPFEVHADVYASRAGQAKATLYQGEALNGLDGAREIRLAPGVNDVVFKSVVRVGGEVTYRLSLDPSSEDKFPENNRVAVTVDVPGRPSVLYVDGEPGKATPLSTALERQGFDVDVRAPASFPGSLREMERYDFVILSDTPAEQISLSSQELIESYLRELGGGFLFAGGPNGYGPGGWYHTAIERVLPVRMDAERKKDMPSVAMSLVIDRSGSMTGLPLEMAKQASRAAVDALAADDLVEIIAFDSTPTRYVKMQPARNRSRIQNDVSRIQAGGGTEIFPALDAAYQDLSVVQARKKHVILLTDGRASSGGVRDLVQTMAAESITVTTVGLGNEVDDQLLSMIKDFGGGRYHKVPDPNNLPKIFTREAEMIAKSAVTLDYFPVRQVSPADFLRGIDIATSPLLAGYTATKMKPPPAQEILVNPDHDDPILARWRVGLGYSLAWTSDVKSRWAADWTRWPGFTQFWGQLVHEHMRQKKRSELEMKTEVYGGAVHAVVDAFNADDRFDNDLESKLTVQGPEPGGTSRVLPLRQTAPGRYEASFTLERYGSFVLRAEHARRTDDGRASPVAVSYGHVSNPYPPEYASFEPNLGLLGRAAETTGGVRDPDLALAFDPAGDSVTFHEDLWPRFVGAAVVFLVLDLLVRRVRLFDRKFLPKIRAA